MKRTVLLAAVVLVAAPLLAQSPDPKGWRNLRWGMTEAEAAKAEPDLAVRLPAPKPEKDRYKAFENGKAEVIGQPFIVWMLFAGEPGAGKLASVVLRSAGYNGTSILYSPLRAAVAEKYGPPTEDRDESTRGMVDKSTIWLLGGTKIEILEMAMGASRFLVVVYSRRATDEPNL